MDVAPIRRFFFDPGINTDGTLASLREERVPSGFPERVRRHGFAGPL